MGKYHFAHCVTKAKIPDEMNKGFGNSVPFNNFQLILLRLLRTKKWRTNFDSPLVFVLARFYCSTTFNIINIPFGKLAYFLNTSSVIIRCSQHTTNIKFHNLVSMSKGSQLYPRF